MTQSELPHEQDSENELFRLLVKNVLDYAIFVIDPAGKVLTWNQGARRLKGYSANEIIGKHFSRFYVADAQAAGHPAYELAIAKELGRYEEEGRRVRKDGTTFWANVVITALFDDNGTHLGYAKVTRDLTERKLAEQGREEANKRLKQQLVKVEKFRADAEVARDEAVRANELKSQFIANISHEIRTPMNCILGLSEILTSDTEGQTKETSALIHSSAQDLMRLLNDLLDFSKLEGNKLEIKKELLQIELLVDDVLTAFYVEASKKKIELRQSVDEEIPGKVLGDAQRIRQVMQHLVHNAIKFTDAGSVEIVVKLTDNAAQKSLKFSVNDTGSGISAENQKRLFQPFVQVDGSATRKFEGAGLGLALSRRLVEEMGGKMGVNSTTLAGSSFWFTVPLELNSISPVEPS